MELNDLKFSKIKNEELVKLERMISEFLKYLNEENQNIKKMEE